MEDTPIERLAFGAAVHKKLKNNFIDTVGDLMDAFRSGEIKWICSASALRQIKTVLQNAHIDIPDASAPASK